MQFAMHIRILPVKLPYRQVVTDVPPISMQSESAALLLGRFRLAFSFGENPSNRITYIRPESMP